MKEINKVNTDGNCIKTLSVWTDTFPFPEYASLKNNVSVDVCIVGAGISGITSAYLLACEGRKVVIIDDGKIGGGETGNTTAHITSVIDDRYSRLENIHGIEVARIAAQSQRDAVMEIERIVLKENINCDFKKTDGYLLFKSGDDLFTEEYEAAMRAGMEVSISDHPLDSFKAYRALKFPGQAQFHILKYISSLAEAITRMDGRIYSDTHVTGIEDNETGAVINTKDGYCIKAGDAVIATNSPMSDYISIHTKQSAFRTYVIGYRIKKNSIPAFLYWDTESPYHYVRVYQENDSDIPKAQEIKNNKKIVSQEIRPLVRKQIHSHQNSLSCSETTDNDFYIILLSFDCFFQCDTFSRLCCFIISERSSAIHDLIQVQERITSSI